MDVFQVTALKDAALDCIDARRNTSIHCRELERIDAASLQVLLALNIALTARGQRVSLSQVPDGVVSYLRVAGAYEMFHVVSDSDDSTGVGAPATNEVFAAETDPESASGSRPSSEKSGYEPPTSTVQPTPHELEGSDESDTEERASEEGVRAAAPTDEFVRVVNEEHLFVEHPNRATPSVEPGALLKATEDSAAAVHEAAGAPSSSRDGSTYDESEWDAPVEASGDEVREVASDSSDGDVLSGEFDDEMESGPGGPVSGEDEVEHE